MDNLDISSKTIFYSREFALATPYQLPDSAARDSSKVQVYLHVPKCGGTTLSQLLECGAQYQARGYRRYVIRDFSPGAFIRPGWTGAWQEIQRKLGEGQPVPDTITGHFPFGVHDLISRECRYITLLRDPVRREVSVFNYMYQKGFIRGNLELEKIIQDRMVLDNPQVRMLAGIDAMYGICTEETYQHAIKNLDNLFDLVGTVEESADFIRALAAWNRWPAMLYARAQVTGIKLITSIAPDVASLIGSYHSFDTRLHRYASEKWRDWKRKWVVAEPASGLDDPALFILPATGRKRQWGMAKVKDIERLTARLFSEDPGRNTSRDV